MSQRDPKASAGSRRFQQPGRSHRHEASASQPELESALYALRDALHPNNILTALQAIGLDSSDLAEGTGVDERTVRRWLGDQAPTRNHAQTIGQLRVLVIHILQRRGLAVDLVARWLRLPDSELRFQTPLEAVAEGRLNDVIVAFDEYVAPRPGTALREFSDGEIQNVGSAGENSDEPERDETDDDVPDGVTVSSGE
jgi:hypothetical protein